MSQALPDYTPWDADTFLEWCTGEEGRWELVDGYPARLMSGATRRHDAIVVNILAELRARLRGRPCRPYTADLAVQTDTNRVRRPDVGIDCGPTAATALKASRTVAVFEVLSPSTRNFDAARKLAEYRALPHLRHIALLSQNEVLATHWLRTEEGGLWQAEVLTEESGALVLDALGVELPFALVYEGALG